MILSFYVDLPALTSVTIGNDCFSFANSIIIKGKIISYCFVNRFICIDFSYFWVWCL